MQGESFINIEIDNPILASIIRKYPSLSFQVDGSILSFDDDNGEECVEYESVPTRLEQVFSCIIDGAYLAGDDEEAEAFEEECRERRRDIMKAYAEARWEYSNEYDLDEPLTDHVGEKTIEEFRQRYRYVYDRHMETEQVDEQAFQEYLEGVTRIRRVEDFYFKNGETPPEGEYSCSYDIVE